MPGLLIAGPDVTLGLDRVLGVADGEAGWHGTMVRRVGGSRASGPGRCTAATPSPRFLASTRNEVERFVTDWESRESAYNL